ncbi:hypothetical protein BDN72DRAFT_188058 [Pluteus cervinus]|uniref:Uncharacterized protein n=1 Tax=Pluteus cervinus TaxID=181527 RepID=A0ACD3AKF8_9AGAR|nr:hypothetical protein BDN72DRAFT_188058 [Pluteus cervinus]
MDSPSAVSFDISGLTRSESFARIDAEIIRLHDQIHSLKGLRNTVAPISSIPNELLSKIFLHSHDADADLDFNQGHSRLTIAWVSHHWRSVALGCSKLWAVVTYQNLHSKPMTCDGLEYARACFERSNNTDMSVLLCKPPKNLVEVCLRHIHQLRDVQLGGEHYHSRIEVPWSLLLWGNPAPRLASLYLENCDFPTPSTVFKGTSTTSSAHPP